MAAFAAHHSAAPLVKTSVFAFPHFAHCVAVSAADYHGCNIFYRKQKCTLLFFPHFSKFVLDKWTQVCIIILAFRRSTLLGDLCNGSTPDSDSVCGGSNPSSPAKTGNVFKTLPVLLFI